MAFPTNPYKNLPGDGIHIPEDLIQGVGEIPQRGTNGELVAVPAGTEGQVPTYQADGTLAPADAASGGGGGGGIVASTTAFATVEEDGAVGTTTVDTTGTATIHYSNVVPAVTWMTIDPEDDTVIHLAQGVYDISIAHLVTNASTVKSLQTFIIGSHIYGEAYDASTIPVVTDGAIKAKIGIVNVVANDQFSVTLGVDSGTVTLDSGNQIYVTKLA